jgi:hypothetical protein
MMSEEKKMDKKDCGWTPCNAPFCDCGFENWTWGDEYRLAEKRDVSASDFWDALRANQANGGVEPDSKPTSRNDP